MDADDVPAREGRSQPSTPGQAPVEQTAAELASTAVGALVEENTHLRRALSTRTIISTAVGVLIERRNCTADEALDWLVGVSQHSNEKVHTIAERLVAEAEGPGH